MEKIQEGLIKGVLNGDMVIISGKVKKNSDEAPEEKTLILSLISAPRCGSSNSLEEEPYGWDAKDFLRQLTLSKVVKYTIDYKYNDKLYGQIFLEGKNLNLELVKNGYAKIGYIQKHNEALAKGEFYAKLQAAEAEAKKKKLNIWETDPDIIVKHKRQLKSSTSPDYNLEDILKIGKDKELDCMVDYVINCAFYVVFLKDVNTFIKLNLRFVAIPNSKDVLYKAGKSYAERLILHKDTKVIIRAIDDSKNFIGDLVTLKGSVASFILQNGYSKLFINNSTPYNTEELVAMKQAQGQARNERLRIWKDVKEENNADDENSDEKGFFVGKDKKGKQSKKSTEIEAVCLQVHSGDSITIRDEKTKEVSRIFLSHIKAPKLARPNKNEEDKPWAWQSREYLRKILVGKKIRSEFDYSKDNPESNMKMNFYSVFRYVDGNENVSGKPKSSTKENTITNKNEIKEKNVNVELLENGYANYMIPKVDDDISKYLDSYQIAEKTAKEKKVGIHSTKIPANSNYSDLITANKTKKKEFINFMVNQKNLQCVVEHCYNGSRFKLRIEKNKCFVKFGLLGIKTFGNEKNTIDLHEKFYHEALNYVYDHLMQREGTCDIIQSDKSGNYFGYLYVQNTNIATLLLKEGLAVTDGGRTNTPIVLMNEFIAAEKSAEKEGKNIWAYPNLSNFLKEGEFTATQPNKFEEKNENVRLRVTDYIDFNNFYINILPNKTLEAITDALEDYEIGSKKFIKLEAPVKTGTLCAARYKSDGKLYRANITKILKDNKFEVEFIDYGTIDVCHFDDLIKIDSSIAIKEPQAVFAEFAYLRYSKHSMQKALEKITDFVNMDLELPGKLCYIYNKNGKTKAGVVVYQSEGKKLEDTYHHDLIKLGYAKLDSKQNIPEYLKDLKAAEKKANQLGIGLWAENEVSDYDEEEDDI
jgi:staphylococcal nuclease domain-containing protein 1